MDFPITPQAVGTLIGAAFGAGVLTQWLKHFLGDWKYIPVFVLLLNLLIQVGAVVAMGSLDWWGAGARGFLGASISVFGYEMINNLLGAFGVGSRATPQ